MSPRRALSLTATCVVAFAAVASTAIVAKAQAPTATQRYWAEVARLQSVRHAKRVNSEPLTIADFVLTWPSPGSARILKDEMATDAMATSDRPVVSDFLKAAKKIYDFAPRSVDEREYMLAFAREALALALTDEQSVGVYALETGGIGPYSRQSGVFTTNQNCQSIPPKGKPAASLALGYVQLLPANTVLTAKKHLKDITDSLAKQASSAAPPVAAELRRKSAVMQKMVDDAEKWVRAYKGKKDGWQEYKAYGFTQGGLATHALNLDAEIGPKLQVYKLKGIVDYATRFGAGQLDSAKLELINIVGDGRGVDALSPPAQQKNVPSTNFFDPSGYSGNPVANGLGAAELLRKLGGIIEKNKQACGSKLFFEAFKKAGG